MTGLGAYGHGFIAMPLLSARCELGPSHTDQVAIDLTEQAFLGVVLTDQCANPGRRCRLPAHLAEIMGAELAEAVALGTSGSFAS
jgi:hypothetical protein